MVRHGNTIGTTVKTSGGVVGIEDALHDQRAVPTFTQLVEVLPRERAAQAGADKARGGNPFVGGFIDVKLGQDLDGIEFVRRAKELDPTTTSAAIKKYVLIIYSTQAFSVITSVTCQSCY